MSIWVALTVGPLLLIGLWLSFHHRPGWYQPLTLDESLLARAEISLAEVADSISDQMVRGEPFEVAVSVADANHWLAAAPLLYPELAASSFRVGSRGRHIVTSSPRLQAGLPVRGLLSAIAVGVDGSSVRLGGLLQDDGHKWGGWQTIVSIELSVTVSADGSEIHVRAGDVRTGSLGVPDGVVRRMLGSWMDDRALSDVLGSVSEVALNEFTSLDDVFTPIRFVNRFVWPNGERPFRIDALDVSDGAILIRFHPLR